MGDITKQLDNGDVALIHEDGSHDLIKPDGSLIKGTLPALKGDLIPGTGDQQAGAIPHPSMFLPTKEQLPALAGATAFGLATGGMGLLPAIGTVAAGAGGGEALKQIYEHAQENNIVPKVFNEAAPKTSGEAALNIGKEAGNAALSELGARGAGKLAAPFASSFTPEIEQGVKTATKVLGQEPPISTMTGNKMVQGLERFSEMSPFGSAVSNQKKLALKGLQDYTDKLTNKIAIDRGDAGGEITGNLAKEAISGLKEKYDIATNKLYDSVMPILKDQPIDLSNTTAKLKDIIGRRTGTAPSPGINEVKQWLSEISSEKPNLANLSGGKQGTIKTFEDLKEFRSRIGQRGNFNDPAISGLKSDIDSLYGAISEDLNNAAKKVSPEAYDGLMKANDLNAEGKNVLKDRVFKSIQNVQPNNVHKVVIVPDSPQNAAFGRELLGDSTFKDVTRQWFDDLVKKSTIVSKDTGEQVLNPSKLAVNMGRYSSVAPELFKYSPEKLQMFNDLFDTAKVLSRGRDITQGSQTAYAAQSILPMITSFIAGLSGISHGTPGVGLGLLGGALGGLGLQGLNTAAVTTPFGKQLLTKGFPRAATAITRVASPLSQYISENLYNRLKPQ